MENRNEICTTEGQETVYGCFTENSSKRSATCKLDLVVVQEVRGDDYSFFYRNENANNKLGTDFFEYKGFISADKRVEFTSDRLSYITVKVPCCDIFLNVHAPTEGKIDESIYEEPERILDQFLK
jgi:hypothetical protein